MNEFGDFFISMHRLLGPTVVLVAGGRAVFVDDNTRGVMTCAVPDGAARDRFLDAAQRFFARRLASALASRRASA